MPDSDKKEFEWRQGDVLDDSNTSPVEEVRKHGLPKVGKSVAAKPEVRKAEREDYLATHQSESYRKTQDKRQQPDHSIIVEEKEARLPDHVEDSEARRLTETSEKKFKGVERFGEKHDKKKDKDS